MITTCVRWLPVLLLLGACASWDKLERDRVANLDAQDAAKRQAVADWEKRVGGWMGRPAADLMAEWGVPTQTVKSSDGQSVLEYDWCGEQLLASNDATAGERLAQAKAANGDWCAERFVSGADGKLVRWSWESNGVGCPLR
jgi:hypothetical protein